MSDQTADDGSRDAGPEPERERPDAHLEDIEDGCGCTEVWDYLSERRADGGSDDGGNEDGSDDPDGRGDDGG